MVGFIPLDEQAHCRRSSAVRQQCWFCSRPGVEPGAETKEQQAAQTADAAEGYTGDGIRHAVGIAATGLAVEPLREYQ